MSLWRRADGKLNVLGQVIHDYATAADGETYAIGRFLGATLFTIASPAPAIAAFLSVLHSPLPKPSEWQGFFTGAAAYYAALSAAVAGLIWGTNPTEPKPPPTVTAVKPPGG